MVIMCGSVRYFVVVYCDEVRWCYVDGVRWCCVIVLCGGVV